MLVTALCKCWCPVVTVDVLFFFPFLIFILLTPLSHRNFHPLLCGNKGNWLQTLPCAEWSQFVFNNILWKSAVTKLELYEIFMRHPGMLTILVRTTVNTNNNALVKSIADTNTNTFVTVLLQFLHLAMFIFTWSSVNKVNKMTVIEKMAKSV